MLDKEKVKIGIAPIGWTNDDMPELGSEISFEQCISEMKEAGYQGTEVGSKYPKDPLELRKKLAEKGLVVAAQWFSAFFTSKPKEETVEAFKKHAQFLKDAGAKIIVVSEQGGSIQGQMDTPVFGNKPVLDEDGFNKLADGLNTIGKIAIDMGMKIVYHHHMGTVIQTREETDKLMEMTDPGLVWLLVDTGHITYSGDDAVSLLESYLQKERVAHVHLKDIRKIVVDRVKQESLSFLKGVLLGTFTVPGDGDIDFKPIFEVLSKYGYEGWLLVEAEQDPAKANPLEYAKKGRQTIKDLAKI